ncbi:T9SS type A sorting domain-containing protein [Hymenobacter sp. ASUV-10]|uniref:T9SS type A sorting domain-containing protein n=1 Tax=Hymenobacter aranciens TaxID=3063996 RepID=A0ABT9BB37_9BACT|nr:T9SS type A sorting domain-containing protein [Hymenobacter sp. ASUV-10]MDO7875479.1 T9SS type A sorting domain-containing protein [Hymenobacter sp. ASUV-10]
MKQIILYLLLLLLLATPAMAGPGPLVVSQHAAGSPLANVLNPDGTLRPGTTGSFDAGQLALCTTPDGRPAFRPAGPAGAGDEHWQGGGSRDNGTDGVICAVAVAGSTVYVGGYFRKAGNLSAPAVAKWDGSAWSSLGTGLNGRGASNFGVRALALAPNGDLYAAGNFSAADSTPVSNIARWNGSTWSALGTGLSGGQVRALALAPNGDLYAGGDFTQAGTATASGIARWNGSTWSPLGTGLSGGNIYGTGVNALAVASTGDVYAGGTFDHAGGLPANHIAQWNGTAWSSLGTGVDGYRVTTVAVAPNGDLYVGGDFALAGSTPVAMGVAKWNSTAWSALGTGLGIVDSEVQVLAIAANGDVYAGIYFPELGPSGVENQGHRVAKWNGATWSGLGTAARGAEGGVLALALDASANLYVAGNFIMFGRMPNNRIVRWSITDSNWNSLGSVSPLGLYGQGGLAWTVVVAPNGDVYAGGYFTQAGNTPVSNIARWNGTAWSSLGTGLNGVVAALAIAPNGDVYAGGTFTQAGGSAVSNVARWDGTTWHPLGAGLNQHVLVLAVTPNGQVYASGRFNSTGTTPINGIAKWDGSTWSSVGPGTSDTAVALAVAPNGDVYAGGFIQGSNVARWDGVAWSTINTPARNANIKALALVANGDMYISSYSSLGLGPPLSTIYKWNGTTWSTLATNFTAYVYNMTIAANGDLYAAGGFHRIESLATKNVARWDGTTWRSLGTGINGEVYSVATGPAGQVYVGGRFSAVGDDSKEMISFGIYGATALTAQAPAAAAPLAVFPNPAHATVTVRLPTGAAPQPLQLTDELGRTVRHYPAPATPNAVLDLHGLPAGVYLVRSGHYSQRLVVE